MQVPVLIVGGGPVGLVASVCLSRLGVRSLLVERHPGTTIHPKARNLNLRTMEILRPWGIDAELFDGALPHSWTGCFVYATTLAGRELGRMVTASFESGRASALTPVVGVLSSQDVYEPVIRRLAEKLGPGELRFHHELEDMTIDGDRVSSRVRSRDDGSVLEIESRFLLGCDGWSSAVRQRLGVAMEGPSDIGHFVNVYFRADLARWTADRPAVLYFVAGDDARGVFQPLDGRGRWLCQISYDGSAAAFAAYTAERCLDWIRRAVGSPDVEAEILSVGTWTMNATVAARVPSGSGPARRRRRASTATHRRVRHEHRRAGRPQPGVEDRAACSRGGPVRASSTATTPSGGRWRASMPIVRSRTAAWWDASTGPPSRTPATRQSAVAASRRYGNFTRHGPRLPLRARRAGARRNRSARGRRPGDRLRADGASRAPRTPPHRRARRTRVLDARPLRRHVHSAGRRERTRLVRGRPRRRPIAGRAASGPRGRTRGRPARSRRPLARSLRSEPSRRGPGPARRSRRLALRRAARRIARPSSTTCSGESSRASGARRESVSPRPASRHMGDPIRRTGSVA